MNHKIMICIVTYNCNINQFKRNIEFMINQVEQILIVDNGSNNILELETEMKKYEKIHIISNESNLGIAHALNQGIDYAYENKFDWMLTLDQDTEIPSNLIYNLYSSYKLYSKKEDVIIICPKFVDKNYIIDINKYNGLNKVLTCITSGSLMNIKKSIEIGKFKEELFIDHVDHEFCLRANLNKYLILENSNIVILHEIGNKTLHKIFLKTIVTTNHSMIRRYYYFRNSLYMLKIYYNKFPKWVFFMILHNINTFLKIIFFEKEKLRKLKFILLGIKDGIFNNYGKFGVKVNE